MYDVSFVVTDIPTGPTLVPAYSKPDPVYVSC